MIALYYTVTVILNWLSDGNAEPEYKNITVYCIEDNHPKQLFVVECDVDSTSIDEINFYFQLNEVEEVSDKTYTLTQL